MCGIAGFVDFADRSPQPDRLKRMTDTLRRRGPDDEGYFESGPAHLGHRRLSIIDLSNGKQPISNEDRTVWIIFNGEIYNYQELAETLKKQGHSFRTQSDTETIVHLYEQHGESCVDYLVGQFAFAIWDDRRQRLFVARDRMGQKPLYYWQQGQKFVFASELKALLIGLDKVPDVDLEALDAYLGLGYVPDPMSIYRDVKKLRPAHRMTCEERGINVDRYWAAPFGQTLNIGVNEACEGVDRLLSQATKLRMIADVPLGAFLSGGIDSSLVVAHMSRHSNRPIKTFCIGFDESTHDERKYASEVARRYETDHQEFVVTPNALEILPDLVSAYDEPYADNSAIPTYYLAQMTRQHVTVALNGDGGDESFAGYGRYKRAVQFAHFQRLPGSAKRLLNLAAKGTAKLGIGRSTWQRFDNWRSFVEKPFGQVYERSMTVTTEQRDKLLSPDVLAQLSRQQIGLVEAAIDACPSSSPIDQVMFADQQVYLPGDLLVKVDRATMWHSLEGRSPFLDHRLVEFAARLPVKVKFHRWNQKCLLKRLLTKEMGHEFVNRPKMGFGVPLATWFRTSLKPFLVETLSNSQLVADNILVDAPIQNLITRHMGSENCMKDLWSLLMLEMWYRNIRQPLAVGK